jgi:hypothetical protein
MLRHVSFSWKVESAFSWANDERMHHYQRRRTSITGLVLYLRKIIGTGRLVVVVMSRLVIPLGEWLRGALKSTADHLP